MVFDRLQECGFRCNLSKCQFLLPQVEYLGHIISGTGNKKSKSNIAAIQNLPRKKNLSELQSNLEK